MSATEARKQLKQPPVASAEPKADLRRVERGMQNLAVQLEQCERVLGAELDEVRERLDRLRGETPDSAADPRRRVRELHRETADMRRLTVALERARKARALDLNAADFEQLRTVGMTVSQAKRVIRYRERNGRFGGLNDLDKVPGFSRSVLAELRKRVIA